MNTSFTMKDFEASQKANKKILVHIHADWCPTCVTQANRLEELRSEKSLKDVVAYRVDFDGEKDFLKRYQVNSQSTFIAFKGTEEIGRSIGKTNATELKAFFAAAFDDTKKLPLGEKEPPVDISKVLKEGGEAPDFSLPDAEGRQIKLSQLLKRGPVVLVFYRGGWCPYCNLQLHELQTKLPLFSQLGAQIVAISSDKPDKTSEAAKKDELKFIVLSDSEGKVSKAYGAVPSTFLIGKDRKIYFSFADSDIRNRAEPSAILKAIKEKELRARLSKEEYEVAVNAATERPFQNRYWNFKGEGIYVDIISGEPLFSSLDKFDSGTGWPSFSRPIQRARVEEKRDSSHGMIRTEVRSSAGSHLGHVFDDGPEELGGTRYCINSAALRFVPVAELADQGYEEFIPQFKSRVGTSR